jgi:hypothetical protein
MQIGDTASWRTSISLQLKPREQNTAQGTLQKSLEDMMQALKRIPKALNLNASRKQAAAEKVSVLIARLQQLKDQVKAIALCGTPEQAKALARELKSIAKELASAAKALGGSGGGAVVVNMPEVTMAGSGATAEAGGAASATDETAVAVAEAVDAAGTDETRQAAEGAQLAQDADAAAVNAAAQVAQEAGDRKADKRDDTAGIQQKGDSGNDDKHLRALLRDARKLLKENIAMLKAAVLDKKGRKELDEAEKYLHDIDAALQGGEQFYTVGGDWADAGGDGGVVDVSA